MFKKLVDNKRKARELADEMKEIKEFFEQCADEDALPDGLGKLLILGDNGVSFSLRAGSPSKTKLREAGVAEDIIKDCSSSYRTMEVF